MGSLWSLTGLNEMFRFCRYTKGQIFRGHTDACFKRNSKERSFYTYMLYLNAGFEGGHTRFLERDGTVIYEVTPKPGLLLCFQHDIFHDGK
jgi:hypothetical protein